MLKSYKGILLDIDNTLYDYNICHLKGLDSVRKYCADNFKVQKKEFDYLYAKSKEEIKKVLIGTAASHNRILYFHRLFEFLQLNPIKYSLIAYNKYWDIFLDEMRISQGVFEFFDHVKNKKICFITDLTTHIQFRKICKLKLEKFTSLIVTSEEAGAEKPNDKIFKLALNKMNLNTKDICMIGDNYEKDIVGANNLGIKAFWLNKNNKKNSRANKSLITEFDNFNDLTKFIS